MMQTLGVQSMCCLNVKTHTDTHTPHTHIVFEHYSDFYVMFYVYVVALVFQNAWLLHVIFNYYLFI